MIVKEQVDTCQHVLATLAGIALTDHVIVAVGAGMTPLRFLSLCPVMIGCQNLPTISPLEDFSENIAKKIADRHTPRLPSS